MKLIKKQWLLPIFAFLLLQVVFVLMEFTGWIPRLREIDGNLFGTLTDTLLFKEWFNFYDTPFFNLFTVFFGVLVIINIIVSLLFKKIKVF
ncbi:YfzA family protein [Solibacillus sp. FSL K6-4121]|uniref:YfzA family protein n=1 Tax=Solibacillus sp. FSL K6-4121 TaxID=2921505 RepID=UPI0030F6AB43